MDKHIKNTFLYSWIILLFSSSLHASFLVEPHFNSISGTFQRADQDGKLKGETLGLRLGYTNRFFSAGVNIERGHFSFDDNFSDTGSQYYQGGGIGTFIGFHFFDRLRIWSAYLNSSLKSNSETDLQFFGQQAEIGLGFRVYKNIFLNYSHYNNFFTQEENSQTGRTGSIDEIIKIQANSLSISSMFIF